MACHVCQRGVSSQLEAAWRLVDGVLSFVATVHATGEVSVPFSIGNHIALKFPFVGDTAYDALRCVACGCVCVWGGGGGGHRQRSSRVFYCAVSPCGRLFNDGLLRGSVTQQLGLDPKLGVLNGEVTARPELRAGAMWGSRVTMWSSRVVA